MLQRLRQFSQARPLLSFVLAGGVLFLLSSAVFEYGRETIVIDAPTVSGMLEARADRLGRDLTPEEEDEALQAYIDEEILLREAYRRGIHLTNARARYRLLRRMRLELGAGIPEPSRAQLRAYYRAPGRVLGDVGRMYRWSGGDLRGPEDDPAGLRLDGPGWTHAQIIYPPTTSMTAR
jgi:hypothetical protein